MTLIAKQLGWRAGGAQIVEEVSLRIESGETFGLVGPNGSGKSTLLRLLSGLAPRPSGELFLDGRPMASLSRREIAQTIAMVEQSAETAEALTVQDAVELGRTPWLSALAPFGANDARIVADALAAVEMSHLASRNWSSLSGGERQRAHIARALAQEPRLLMLDEPTNHLDIHHQLALLRLVSRLPLTVVMALHDLNQAMGCDRVGVMDRGRLIACGPPAEVLSSDLLRHVFRVGAVALRDPTDNATIYRFHHLEGVSS